MGLFDFLKPKENLNTLKESEKETSKQLYNILLQVQNGQEQDIEVKIKALAFRIYQHAFHRAKIPFVNVMDFLDPLKMLANITIKPSPMTYVAFYRSISESLELLVSDNRYKKTNLQLSAVDISTLQLIKMFSENLPSFLN